jgi:hypothetical protein
VVWSVTQAQFANDYNALSAAFRSAIENPIDRFVRKSQRRMLGSMLLRP